MGLLRNRSQAQKTPPALEIVGTGLFASVA
jgi:hypothetical protein